MSNELKLELIVPRELNPGGVIIRTAGTAGEPLFCLADVCKVLGISDARRVAERIDEEDRSLTPVLDGRGVEQQAWFVNEGGLYTTLIRSDAENAKPFRKWVCGEVLPSIRRHGCYPPPAVAADQSAPSSPPASPFGPDMLAAIGHQIRLIMSEAKPIGRPHQPLYHPRRLIRDWWPDCDHDTVARIVQTCQQLYRAETGEMMLREGNPDGGPLVIEASRIGLLVEAFSHHFRKAFPARPPELSFPSRAG